MITYLKFKEIFDSIDANKEPEIEFYFKNRKNNYMIIKYNNYVTFQRCGKIKEQSGEIKFKSLDELCNNKTIDNIILINEWDNIDDILIDCTFSVIEDKDIIYEVYGVKI